MTGPPPAGYRTMYLDELEAAPWMGGRLTWHPLRGQLGIRAFGAGAFTAACPSWPTRHGRTSFWRACSTRPPDGAQAIVAGPPEPAGARGRPPATSSNSAATRPASAGHA